MACPPYFYFYLEIFSPAPADEMLPQPIWIMIVCRSGYRTTAVVIVIGGMSTLQNSNFFLLSSSPLTFSDDPHVYSLINLHCNFDEAMRCIPQPTRPPAFNLIT